VLISRCGVDMLARKTFTQYHMGWMPEQMNQREEKLEKGGLPPDFPGTRRTSLPVISAAQERDPRYEDYSITPIRPFVILLAARPQESGETALILARFYMSPPAA
jgi:hypothetical protein